MFSATGISRLPSLSQPPSAQSGATLHDSAAVAKMKSTAKEFEATFLSMLIKEMRQPMEEDGDGAMFQGDSGDVQGGLFDMFMGRHLAEVGGVGVAAFLLKHMPADAVKPAASTDATVARIPHDNIPSAARR